MLQNINFALDIFLLAKDAEPKYGFI